MRRTDFVISPLHLAGVIEQATDAELALGREWYERERGWIEATAHVYEATPEQVAAITAVLSSNAPWDEASTTFNGQHTNKGTVITLLDILCDHPDQLDGAKLFATQAQRRKARAIYEDPDFRLTPALGPKMFPFACNLLGDYEQLTLDQYAWGAVIGWLDAMPRLPAITKRRREASEVAYLWLAERLGVKLAVAQAMTWVPYRRIRRELKA